MAKPRLPSTGTARRSSSSNGVPSNGTPSADVLNSWKEIAEFMGRTVRTVQRWERNLQLPVQRPRGDRKNVVFARPVELRRWMDGRGVSDPERVHVIRANLQRMHALCLAMTKQTEILKERATGLADELRAIQRRRTDRDVRPK